MQSIFSIDLLVENELIEYPFAIGHVISLFFSGCSFITQLNKFK